MRCIYSYCEELEEKKGKSSLMVENSFFVSENVLALSKRYLWKGERLTVKEMIDV